MPLDTGVLQFPDRPLEDYSDQELMAIWKQAGQLRRNSDRLFLAMVPAIAKRGLHRRGFTSISHAAAVLGGISQEVIRGVMDLHRRIAPTAPRIWALFEQGHTGWTVLKRIAGHLSDEGEDYWLDVLQKGLSRREIGKILEEKRRRVSGVRTIPGVAQKQVSGDFEASSIVDPLPTEESRSVSGNGPFEDVSQNSKVAIRFHLDDRTVACFEAMRRAMEAREGRKISASEAMSRMIRQVAKGTSEKEGKIPFKEVVHTVEGAKETFLASVAPDVLQLGERVSFLSGPRGPIPLRPSHLAEMVKVEKVYAGEVFRAAKTAAERSESETVPRRVQGALAYRSGGICEAGHCRERATCVHHRKNIPANPRDHRLSNLAHLCETCHHLLHLGLVANPHAPLSHWRFRQAGDKDPSRKRDRKFQEIRWHARTGAPRPVGESDPKASLG